MPDARTIVDCSGVGAGGIIRVLTEVVRYWPAGRTLQIVAAPPGWETPAEATADVEIHSRQSERRAGSIAVAPRALRRVTARARRDRTRPTRVLSLSPSVAVSRSRLPVTTVVHDLAFRLWPYGLPAAVRNYRKVSHAAAIKRSARLLCVSARTQHDLLGMYGVPVERTRVWHPGSDLSVVPGRLPEPLAKLHGKYLLIAGHASHKGVELAIDAIADLAGLTLVVLTGGQKVGEFEAAAARSSVGDRVLFLDRITDGEYAAAIGAAHAFLMPSHFEGYGLPAAEALRLGTPTVISPDPALHEATGGAAVQMTTWTADALVRAVREVDKPRLSVQAAGRSWRDATAHLVRLLAEDTSTDRAGAELGD